MRLSWMLPVVAAVLLTVGCPSAWGGSAKAPTAGATQSVTGPVKGAPTGKTFVIARKGGTITVDASAAKFRDDKGRFGSIAAIKGGTMVTAKGTMSGTTLKATDVQYFPRTPKTKPPAKAGAGK